MCEGREREGMGGEGRGREGKGGKGKGGEGRGREGRVGTEAPLKVRFTFTSRIGATFPPFLTCFKYFIQRW